ncbi:hypothetical protein HYW42_04555 [Candidatus Daviesbacteria bacterium]|nr:hypothetical protein [Candidatus Daviesbacteria bacterium]
MDNQIPPEVRGYLDNLLTEAGITAADGNMHKQLIDDLYVRLDNFLSTTILDNLPPEHLDQFSQMVDQKRPQQEIQQFLKEKIPNSEDVFAKAMLDFRDLYLGNTVISTPVTN